MSSHRGPLSLPGTLQASEQPQFSLAGFLFEVSGLGLIEMSMAHVRQCDHSSPTHAVNTQEANLGAPPQLPFYL